MEGVEIRRLDRFEDDRGWLLKVLTRKEMNQNNFGEIYITTAYPGAVKAEHYHKHTNEWFCVIRGTALLVLHDIESAKREEIVMGAGNLISVKVPNKIVHSVKNIGEDMMYLVAIADRPYNHQKPDTYPYNINS